VNSQPDFRQWADQMARFPVDAERMRADFDRTDIVGISPDGTVRVTARSGRTAAIEIDPAAMAHDSGYVAAQVLAAVQQAERRTADLRARSAEPVTRALESLLRDER
jgi:DNA-binding protein YbaB